MLITWYKLKIKKQVKEYECYIRFKFDPQMQSIKIKAFIYLTDSEGNICITEKKNKLGYDPRILGSLTVEKNFLKHKRKSNSNLYYEVMSIFNRLPKDEGNVNSKKDLIGVNSALKEIDSIIVDSEDKVEKYIKILESYEESNKYLFGRVCNHLRNSRKERKVNILKKILANDEKEKSEQKKEEKIIFIRRKAEPPFHPNKKKKKIKLDPEIIKQLEDEELITYK